MKLLKLFFSTIGRMGGGVLKGVENNESISCVEDNGTKLELECCLTVDTFV